MISISVLPVSDSEMRDLSQLCTLCDLCPCPNIRADIIKAKSEVVSRDGLSLKLRLLAEHQPERFWSKSKIKTRSCAF